jgi:hypothetical protein
MLIKYFENQNLKTRHHHHFVRPGLKYYFSILLQFKFRN